MSYGAEGIWRKYRAVFMLPATKACLLVVQYSPVAMGEKVKDVCRFAFTGDHQMLYSDSFGCFC